MKKIKTRKMLPLIFVSTCFILISIFLSGCNEKQGTPSSTSTPIVKQDDKPNAKATPVPLKLTKASETLVKAGSAPTSINYTNLVITLPQNVVSSDKTFTVSSVSGANKPFDKQESIMEPTDFKLEDQHLFKNPIFVDIPYNKDKLNGIAAANAFLAVYYNETTGKWDEVPYEVDTVKNVVRLKLYHLSTVACYYSRWEGAWVHDSGSAYIIYNLNEGTLPSFSQYETAVNRSSSSPTLPVLVTDCGEIANEVMKAYRELYGLTLTGKPNIYLTRENNYGTNSGNLSITLDSTSYSNPREMFMRNIAHEMFHKAQADTLGYFTYSSTTSIGTSYWMEATADYMGNTGLPLALGRAPIDRYEDIGKAFFDVSLTTMNKSHEYAAAYFVKFMAGYLQQNLSPLTIIQMAGGSSIALEYDSRFSKSKFSTMLTAYDGFLEYMLFDQTSSLVENTNQALERTLDRLMTPIVFNPNAKGEVQTPVQEGAFLLQIPEQYSAAFHGLKCDSGVSLEITAKGGSVYAYTVSRTQARRSFKNRVFIAAGATETVRFTKNDFVMIVATAITQKDVSINYKATYMPMPSGDKPINVYLPLQNSIGDIPDKSTMTSGLAVWLKMGDASKTITFGSMQAGGRTEKDIWENSLDTPSIVLTEQKDGSFTASAAITYSSASMIKNGDKLVYTQAQHSGQMAVTVTIEDNGYRVVVDIDGNKTDFLFK